MGNLWLKVKVWTKVVVFGLLLLYVVTFIVKNNGEPVPFWFWFGHDTKTSPLMLIFWAAGTSVAGTLLVQTTFKTVRQVRDAHERGQEERRRRQAEDQEEKAARLRVRPDAAAPEERAGRGE